jgi:hypothetical protein
MLNREVVPEKILNDEDSQAAPIRPTPSILGIREPCPAAPGVTAEMTLFQRGNFVQ